MNKRRQKARAEPTQRRSAAAWLCDASQYDSLACRGYISLAQNPEIAAGVDTIARLVGSMTINLMQNTDAGDMRIRNELARKIDINPNSYTTRAGFVHWIVRTMYLEGQGNAVVWPNTRAGIIRDLNPVPPAFVSFIPSDQFSVEQIKPLTLSDLALDAMVTLDKRTVAAVLGIPPFVLGVGDFNRDAWNNFVNTTIMPLARCIEQELTRKLLYSPDLFFRFNSWSLYSYNITELVSAGAEMVDRMALRRNEWRGWLNLPPDPDMNELLALENYIPADRLGDQGKLTQGGE